MRKKILDFFLPPRCACCGIETLMTPALCAACWEKIHFIEQPLCDKCGMPFEVSEGETKALCLGCLMAMPSFHRLRSAFSYDEVSKALILQFKHGDALHLAPLLVQWLSRAGLSIIKENEVLVPVPLHWRRLWTRNYNQAAILAHGLSQIFGKTYEPRVLERPKNVPSQGRKTAQQRQKNVKDSFRLFEGKRKCIEGKKVLLIDDVYTSGATVNECVNILHKSGAQQVDVLTLARVIRA